MRMPQITVVLGPELAEKLNNATLVFGLIAGFLIGAVFVLVLHGGKS